MTFFISDTKCCQNDNFDWKIFILLDWLSSRHKWQGYTHQMPNLPSNSSSYQSEMCMNVEQVKLDRKKLDKFEWKPIIKYETVYSLDIHGIHLFIWGLWRRKQISQKRISNSIPQYSVRDNYPCLRYLLVVPKSSYNPTHTRTHSHKMNLFKKCLSHGPLILNFR